ncbi:MAG TPA: YraN family protein [Micromonosporaceae bacterium]
MTTARQALGAYGERRAAIHLTAAGLRIVARNWRCSLGEIDIIAWERDVLVFCEVKTRRSTAFGTPAEAVLPTKARRLRRLAAQWMTDNKARPREVRFDVIEVLLPAAGAPRLNHIRGAF